MKNTELYGTSNTELVTISRAEYEELQAQSQRVSALEKHVDILLEALRLARHKQFGASSEKSDEMLTEQLSFLFNEAEVLVSCSMKRRYLPNPRRKKLPLWLLIRATKSMNTPWTTFRKACPQRW